MALKTEAAERCSVAGRPQALSLECSRQVRVQIRMLARSPQLRWGNFEEKYEQEWFSHADRNAGTGDLRLKPKSDNAGKSFSANCNHRWIALKKVAAAQPAMLRFSVEDIRPSGPPPRFSI